MDKEKKPMIIETADIYLHFPYIMKEEADDLADFLEEEHIEYEGATDIFIDLQNQTKKQKEVIDKAIEYINDNLTISSILDGKKYYTINNYSFDYKELLDILNEVSEWIMMN